ncbi:hypothetical protein EC991_009394 [Linnemannia zychae]|nr:hypothetical protein EC991_009394 [Linnemannia zychae]
MEAQGTQAVQRVYEDEETIDNPVSTRTIHIVCHSDASIEKDILLWDYILAVFSTALYVRSGVVALPFLKGPNFELLKPLRIAAVPGVTLDVVVKGQSGEKGLTMVSLQKALPNASQENNLTSTAIIPNADTTTVRRNPVGGLVEKAMDAYRDNINPAFGPKLRGPQALVGDEDGSPTTADQGFAPAQYNLGSMYRDGLGVPQDYSAALDWYHQAASQGYAEAQYSIGLMYRHGQDVPQDFTAAMEWYQKAASKGHDGALKNIGMLYDNGLGVPQSDSLAMEWYRKAADQGLSIAQYNIGAMFEIGQGVPKDIAAAVEWYKKAVVGGQADAE